ncbi:MAG: bifunctional demethylmenaquinone methyltransferase/2-methoxy-6-polyprenyl-1,4-benzoquinol methylase UbiE [Saprospiraceae bacterium]|nr:bifunctional demethylmenaquinone methyltransferase/2-methoxy-6-polyprenyl-1,4-benzoquinol methylase UbiE [Saprospiraceae bacterium]MCB0678963.1 bifunctional demethylmenaquinone methyltransferase/2-methoxy-6-polyprenyl-1,4-benzoquinol methylase UbiE [Saprospiraceae bacterium]MCB0682440.1 bifunctional demethylmenaquinone methyltransferase/2-methoxy-6-polyprenyl-1,4-benzoquinol methylase UbiE [Saprospiraceae bacterium]
MFDNIAPSYDLLNRLLSLGIDRSWRKKAIRLLDPAKAKTVLDVATGTADVAIEIARQLKPEKIIGVDIAQQMLEIGREKVSKRGLAEVIELQLGDSENLPFESNTFDAITVAFGVRNFEDLGKGLSEMQRVLKPGGKLVVLEFSRPRIFPFKQLFNLYFRYLLPLIGRLTSKDPKAYSYLYESVQAFPDRENFVTELGKAGYTEASYRPLTLGICSIYSASK